MLLYLFQLQTNLEMQNKASKYIFPFIAGFDKKKTNQIKIY